MIVKVKKRENPYVQMDVRFLSDDRLTAKAKGILAYLLSKPADWEVRIKDLESKFSDGATSLRSGMKELREFGYAELIKLRGEGGKMIGSSYIIRELPKDFESTEIAVFRNSDNPKLGYSEIRETAIHSNIEHVSNIEVISNKEEKKHVDLPEGKSTSVLFEGGYEASNEFETSTNIPAKEKSKEARKDSNTNLFDNDNEGCARESKTINNESEKISYTFEACEVYVNPSAKKQFMGLSEIKRKAILAVFEAYCLTFGKKQIGITKTNFATVKSALNCKIETDGLEASPTIQDFKDVFLHKKHDWAKNPKMSGYLVLETLCNSKFESYLYAARQAMRKNESVSVITNQTEKKIFSRKRY